MSTANATPDSVHTHVVQIYYEDTDHSGLVYHANYLKYFERAREHMLGVDELVRLDQEEGVSFVVYKVELTFREGAKHGDSLEIRSRVRLDGAFRALFDQQVWRPDGDRAMVEGMVQLVCIDRNHKLVPLPAQLAQALNSNVD